MTDSGESIDDGVALGGELGGVGDMLPRTAAAQAEVRAWGRHPVRGGFEDIHRTCSHESRMLFEDFHRHSLAGYRP